MPWAPAVGTVARTLALGTKRFSQELRGQLALSSHLKGRLWAVPKVVPCGGLCQGENRGVTSLSVLRVLD